MRLIGPGFFIGNAWPECCWLFLLPFSLSCWVPTGRGVLTTHSILSLFQHIFLDLDYCELNLNSMTRAVEVRYAFRIVFRGKVFCSIPHQRCLSHKNVVIQPAFRLKVDPLSVVLLIRFMHSVAGFDDHLDYLRRIEYESGLVGQRVVDFVDTRWLPPGGRAHWTHGGYLSTRLIAAIFLKQCTSGLYSYYGRVT